MNSNALQHGPVPMHPKQYKSRDIQGRAIGWSAVALVHALVLWALVSGTAQNVIQAIKKPLEAVVIQEVIIPPPPPQPPPPPPPPRKIERTPPRVEAPPPPYVPPPEVAPAPTFAPAIETVQVPPPAPPVIAPPSPAPSPRVQTDMTVACPTQVRPEMPRQALNEGIEGTVRAQALIRGGKVVEVTILSGPRVFHTSVRNAMLRYGCASAEGDRLAIQNFDFKFE